MGKRSKYFSGNYVDTGLIIGSYFAVIVPFYIQNYFKSLCKLKLEGKFGERILR